MKRVVPLVVLSVLWLLLCVRPAVALRVYPSGDFDHGQSSVPYVNHWSGALDAEVVSDQSGTVLTLELARVTAASGALSGLFVGAADIGGFVEGTFVTGSELEIVDNLIGVHVDSTPPDEDPKYHPELCLTVELFDGNERDSKVTPVVLPCGFGEVSARCPPSACRAVPFDCTWCGEG
jgi:hypothetical protein